MPLKTARTLASVRAELTTAAMTIRFNRHNDEYRVNFKNGVEVDAYYTNDLADALSTGLDMARRRDEAAAINASSEANIDAGAASTPGTNMTVVVIGEDEENVLAVYSVKGTRREAAAEARRRMVALYIKDGIDRPSATAFADDCLVVVTPTDKVDGNMHIDILGIDEATVTRLCTMLEKQRDPVSRSTTFEYDRDYTTLYGSGWQITGLRINNLRAAEVAVLYLQAIAQ